MSKIYLRNESTRRLFLLATLLTACLVGLAASSVIDHNVDAAAGKGLELQQSSSEFFGVAGAIDLNQAGDYVFLGSGQSGLFLRPAATGVTQRILQMGDPMPLVANGQVDLIFAPRINSSGKVAFAVDYGTPTIIQRAILLFDGASLQKIIDAPEIAPGTGGSNFGRLIGFGGLNDSGDIAFTANLASGSQSTLFYVPNGGATMRVVGPGDPAPGTGGTFGNILLALGANSLNLNGEVLFTAQVVGGSGGFGWFVGSQSGVRKVVSNGDPIPGGGTFSITAASASGIRFNNNGEVAFIAAPSTTIWLHSSLGGLVKAVAAGDAAPAAIGGTFSTGIALQAFSDSGQLAFTSNINGGLTTSGLFRFAPGPQISTIASVNQQVPGHAPLTFTGFSSVSMNGFGLVSFRANLANGTPARGVFQQSGLNLPVELALEGDAQTITPGGGTINLANSTVTRTLNAGLTYGFADILGGTADYIEVLIDPAADAIPLMSNADPLPAGSRTSRRTFRVGAAGDFVAFLTQQAGGRRGLTLRNVVSGTSLTVANDGDVAPGTGGGKFRLTNLNVVFVNANGTIAFPAQVMGGTQGISIGIFAATSSGVVTKLINGGELFSGSPLIGPVLNGFTPSPLNATGQVVFRGQVLNVSGIYIGTAGGPIQRVTQVGDSAPGGGTFAAFGGNPAINSSGQIAFFATTTGGPGQNQGIFVWSGGVVAKVAVSADPSPAGNTFAAFSNAGFSFNDSGEVAFLASHNGGGGPGAFVGTTSSIQTVAVSGSPAPSGGNFSLTVNADILINNQHDVAFRAALTSGSADSGYFLRRGLGGPIQTVAVQGQTAPGLQGPFTAIAPAPNGFLGENFALGPTGEVLFTQSVQINSENQFGAFRFRTDNLLEKIVFRGDVVPNTGNGIFAGAFAGAGAGSPGRFAFWAETVGGNVTDAIYVTNQVSGFSISGRVTNVNGSSVAGSGVLITGSVTGSTTTDASGNYSFANLPPNGNYTVTPSNPIFSFAPTSQTFNNLAADRVANFVGTQTIVSISGNVVDAGNAPLNNVTLSLTKDGIAAGSVQTNSLGDYGFANLAAGSNYVVTPAGSFIPSSQTFGNLTTNGFANFKATPSIPLQCNTPSFGSSTPFATASSPTSVAAGDFNGDGKVDLVVANAGSNNVSVLLGSGTGTFSAATNFAVGTNPRSVAVSDFNGDGKSDLAVVNQNSSFVSILLGTGTGSFTPAINSAIPSGGLPTSLAVSDFNSDSKLDLAVASAILDNVSILLGTGTGTFGTATSFAVGTFPFSVKASDFNNDGKPDLVVANNNTSNVSILLGTGTGSFTPASNFLVSSGGFPKSVAVGEFNGDGNQDLAVTNDGDNNLSVLLGNGSGGFSIATNVGVGTSSVAVADLNGDAKSDLAFANLASGVSVVLGLGNGTFASAISFPGGDARSIATADFNGDGKADFVVSNGSLNNIAVYLNIGATCNSQTLLSISGQVKNAANQPLSDVAVTLSGPITRVVTSDANGNYSFPSLAPGGNYAVTVQSNYYVFGPSRADLFNLSSNQTVNFNAAPNVVPLPTPTPSDNFNTPTRDPERWNLGTQTQPVGAVDPQVTMTQVNGQLVIKPVAQAVGLHYNGYVSANSFDFRNGVAGVELVQAASGGADSIFAIGSDRENFTRFVVHTAGGPSGVVTTVQGPNGIEQPLDTSIPQLIFQVAIGGQQLQTVSIPYDPVQHRHLRFRHEAQANAILFETSPNNIDFVERHRVSLQKSVAALTAELSAGTPSPTNPGQTIFDNFNLVTSTYQFSAANYAVGEGEGSIVITVTRQGSPGVSGTTATVSYQTEDGTAQQKSRYIPAVGTLTFGPGVMSRTFTVLVVDNVLTEGNQTVNLLLGNPLGSGLNTPGRAVLTIIDNDTLQSPVNPLDEATFYAQQHYLDFLNRQPDPSGVAFWANEITSCGADVQCKEVKRINVSAAFFLSIEFQETGYLVERIYKVAYGDATGTSTFGGTHQLIVPIIRREEFLPDTQEIGLGLVVGPAGWEQKLEQNKAAFANGFVQRTRFQAAYANTLTPAQYVDLLFQHAGVTPTTAERTAAINEFAGAQTSADAGARGRALRRVAENGTLATQESNRAFVLMQYFGYLRRNPNDPQDTDYGGYDFWLTKLNQFNGNAVNAEMVKAFILSGEYRHRFGP